MEDGRINDDQIRATSPRSGPSGAIYARFNHTDGNGGWCPDQEGPLNKTQYSQYIQVKLDEPVRIKGIDLQGSSKGLGKVERFLINYTPHKSDPSSWKWLGNLQEVCQKQESVLYEVHKLKFCSSHTTVAYSTITYYAT